MPYDFKNEVWEYHPGFLPVNPATPEGGLKIREMTRFAMFLRLNPPQGEPDLIIPYNMDDNFFGEEIYPQVKLAGGGVLAVVPEKDDCENDFFRDFARKFVELHLYEEEEARNLVEFICARDFAKVQVSPAEFRAIIWLRARDAALPPDFELLDSNFAVTISGAPVYIFGLAMLTACAGRDLDSDFVKSRMDVIARQGLSYAQKEAAMGCPAM